MHRWGSTDSELQGEKEGPLEALWHRITWLGELGPKLKQNYLQLYVCVYIYVHTHEYMKGLDKKKDISYYFSNITGMFSKLSS